MKRPGWHKDEITAVELALERFQQERREVAAGALEKSCRRLEARPRTSPERQAPEGELQRYPFGLGERGVADAAQTKTSAICDDDVELAFMLHVFDEDTFPDRRRQLIGTGQPGRCSELARRDPAPLADLSFEGPLPLGKQTGVRPLERGALETGDRVPQRRKEPRKMLVARWGGPGAPQRASAPPLGPAQHLQGAPRLEGEAQAEPGELGDRHGGANPQLGRTERRPMVLGDGQAGTERREGAASVTRCEAA